MFRNTGVNAFAKNQTRLAYEDERNLYCMCIDILLTTALRDYALSDYIKGRIMHIAYLMNTMHTLIVHGAHQMHIRPLAN